MPYTHTSTSDAKFIFHAIRASYGNDQSAQWLDKRGWSPIQAMRCLPTPIQYEIGIVGSTRYRLLSIYDEVALIEIYDHKDKDIRVHVSTTGAAAGQVTQFISKADRKL
jgi:hypothetical protein